MIIITVLITSISILLKNISESLYLKNYCVISFFSKITVADLIADLLIVKIQVWNKLIVIEAKNRQKKVRKQRRKTEKLTAKSKNIRNKGLSEIFSIN